MERLIGKVASRCWLGYGRALSFEFGELTEDGGGEARGEWGLRCDLPGWRIEMGDEVLAGSEDVDRKAETAMAFLTGRRLESGSVCTTTGDTVLRFSGGLRVRTFVNITEEDARWRLRGPDGEGESVGPCLVPPKRSRIAK